MEVTDMEFQSIVPSIQNGEYDFSIAAMYKTDERCEVVDMSKSYCDSGMILAVKEDSEYADTVKSLADCVNRGKSCHNHRSCCKKCHCFCCFSHSTFSSLTLACTDSRLLSFPKWTITACAVMLSRFPALLTQKGPPCGSPFCMAEMRYCISLL